MARQCDVLLIEDNPGDARLIELMLEDLRNSTSTYTVDHRSSLADALEAAESHHFDVVLLDLSLPDADGIDCLASVQEHLGDTPVILVTGRGSESLAVEAMKTGAADYLSKNDLAADVLHRTIHSALEHAQYARKLQELEVFKANIVATASHELRTPLAIIREYVALVRDGIPGPVNESQGECLDGALRNCDRLASLINDTLDLHRLEQGSTPVRRSRTDLWALLDTCARDFQPQFEKKGQKLVVDLPDDLPAVLADADQVSQVIVNLIGNAHKFTPSGGRVVLGVTARTRDVVVRVSDDGPGIRIEDQERVFEPFAQIDRIDAPGAQGTGLGLPICQRIVTAHEGTLDLESEPGQGSTFSFTLPIHGDRDEMIALLRDQSAAAAHQARRVGFVAVKIRPLDDRDTRNLVQEVATVVGATLRRKDDVVLVSHGLRVVMAVGQIERPDAPGLLGRLERSVLEALGRTVPVDFAAGEVAHDDDPVAVVDGMTFAPASQLPTRALVIGSAPGVATIACRTLADSGLLIDVVSAEDVYQGMLAFGRFEPNLVLIDSALPRFDIVSQQIAASNHRCHVLVLSDQENDQGAMQHIVGTNPLDPHQLVAQVAQLARIPTPTSELTAPLAH